jgi:anaerobic magnesium-protoporphyrin IX monomethyl ester cyclase
VPSGSTRRLFKIERNMRSKVLLLYPRLGAKSMRPQPPFPLLAIATYVEVHGVTPVIMDQRVEHDYEDRIKDILPETLFVGITSMTGAQLRHAVELIAMVKRHSPQTPVVFGGVHASLLPDQTIRQDGVDLVVVGEGESVIGDVLLHYQGKKSIEEIRGIYFKRGSDVIATPPRPLMDLESLKAPAWHLIHKNKYRVFGIQCGRGCPHRCAFCYNIKFNERKWRFRHPEDILRELQFLSGTLGVSAITFLDDNFFASFDKVSELCNLILKHGIALRWGTTCRSDYFRRFTPEFMALLKRSGLDWLFVGAESGSPEILRRIDKDITVEDNISVAVVAKKYDLRVTVSFMSGFPYESPEDRSMTYNLMDRMKAINPNLRISSANVFTPYPGNSLYEEAKQYGLKEPASLSGWETFVFSMSNLPWLPKAENNMLENISSITSFYFWFREIKERFLKWHYYPFYIFLRTSARLRWRLRFFRCAWEWDLFRAIRKNFLE